ICRRRGIARRGSAAANEKGSDRSRSPIQPATAEKRESYQAYFNDVLMLVNLVFNVEPRPLTAAMMARLMPAAIRPYSMAVAADSSFRNLKNIRDNPTSWFFAARTFAEKN